MNRLFYFSAARYTIVQSFQTLSENQPQNIERKNHADLSSRNTKNRAEKSKQNICKEIIAVFFLSKTQKITSSSSSSSSYSTSPSSSSFVTAQSLRNIQIVLLPGSSEGDFFQALSLSSILAAGLHESRTWPISLDREPTKPRNST
jgi:hypothetical protein